MADYDIWLINVECRMTNEKWVRMKVAGYTRDLTWDTILQFSCRELCKYQIILSPGRDWKRRRLEYKSESNREVSFNKVLSCIPVSRRFFVAQQTTSGLAPFIVKVSTSHKTIKKNTHTHTVGVLWARDQLVAEAATYTTHSRHIVPIWMPSAGLENAIPAIRRL
jgi:hypothetical protein